LTQTTISNDAHDGTEQHRDHDRLAFVIEDLSAVEKRDVPARRIQRRHHDRDAGEAEGPVDQVQDRLEQPFGMIQRCARMGVREQFPRGQGAVGGDEFADFQVPVDVRVPKDGEQRLDDEHDQQHRRSDSQFRQHARP
jgi:hypothetical protein